MFTRNRIAATLTAVTLTFGLAACDENRSPSDPSSQEPEFQPASQVGQGTAALIAALNNVAVVIGELNLLNNVTIGDITVVDVDNVLNNTDILRNARFLNNITILQDFLNDSVFLTNFLNDANILVTDVVAIDVLSGGDLIVFTR